MEAESHSSWDQEIWVQVPVWHERAIKCDQGLHFNRSRFSHLQNENLQCVFLCIIMYYFIKQAWIKWPDAFHSQESWALIYWIYVVQRKQRTSCYLTFYQLESSNVPFWSYHLSQRRLLSWCQAQMPETQWVGITSPKRRVVKIGLDNLRANN